MRKWRADWAFSCVGQNRTVTETGSAAFITYSVALILMFGLVF